MIIIKTCQLNERNSPYPACHEANQTCSGMVLYSHFVWTHTIIIPGQWQVLYFNDKSFFFLFCLPVTTTGFTLKNLFTQHSWDCIWMLHAVLGSSCMTDTDSLGNIQQKRAMMVDTCSRRKVWRDRVVEHGEWAVPGSPNSSPYQCPQRGFKELELAGEEAEVTN